MTRTSAMKGGGKMGDRELLEYLLAAEGYDNQTDFAEDMIFGKVCLIVVRDEKLVRRV